MQQGNQRAQAWLGTGHALAHSGHKEAAEAKKTQLRLSAGMYAYYIIHSKGQRVESFTYVYVCVSLGVCVTHV